VARICIITFTCASATQLLRKTASVAQQIGRLLISAA